MGFKTGIVGLPNVGKSTLFNALTRTAAAQAENYPFCTIEPNSGEVAVPDIRLEEIARIVRSHSIVPARMTFTDIAGLVGGASKGLGLGNKFLANIREVDAILHLVRCFEDDDIVHVAGKVDPIDDIQTIETELMLADLEMVERVRTRLVRKLNGADPEAMATDSLLKQAQAALEAGEPASSVEVPVAAESRWQQIGLLTAKPVLFVCNVDEMSAGEGNRLSSEVAEYAARRGNQHVICCAAIEEQLAEISPSEAEEYLEELNCGDSGLKRVISAGYQLLGLQTFFTANAREANAWTIPTGATALDAAGKIHSDLKRGFVRAETVSYTDYVAYGGEAGAKEAGRFRSEGKNYRVEDGDVLHILFNV